MTLRCPYCSESHNVEKCPRVQSIEYNPDGTIKKVELRDNGSTSLRGRIKNTEDHLHL
jgi:hypothetical protein